MALSVRELFQIPKLHDIRLVAGKKGINNQISWVNILELLDELNQLSRGELLLTTGFDLLSYSNDYPGLLQRLMERDLAGLAIKTGIYVDNIPDDFINCAEERGFPLLQISGNTKLSEISRAIITRIEAKKEGEKELLHSFEQQINYFPHFQNTLEEIAAVLAEHLNVPVRILGNDLSLLTYKSPHSFATSHLVQNYPKERKELLCFNIFPLHPQRGVLFHISPKGQIPEQIVSQIITDSGEVCGYLSVLSDKDDFPVSHQNLIRHACELCALEFARNGMLQKIKENPCPKFLTSGKYRVVLCSVDIEQHILKQKRLSSFNLLKNDVFAFIQNKLKQEWPDCISRHHEGKLIAFFPDFSHAYIEDMRQILSDIVQNVQAKFAVHVSFGISNLCPESLLFKNGVSEAQEALEVGCMMWGKGFVAFYENIELYRVFLNTPKQNDLVDFSHKTLGQILEYDRTHRTELLKTLEVYLQNGRNIRQTSQILKIHRHTVKNRLKKIEEITHIPLNNEGRFQLQFALTLKHLYQIKF